MSPAEGERRLISAMTASRPSRRRRAAAKDGGRGSSASSRASSASGTGRSSGAISRRFQFMISVSLSAMAGPTKDAKRPKVNPFFCVRFGPGVVSSTP